MLGRKDLETKLEQAQRAREQLMAQASQQLGQLDGRIATLKELLAELDGEEQDGDDEADIRPVED